MFRVMNSNIESSSVAPQPTRRLLERRADPFALMAPILHRENVGTPLTVTLVKGRVLSEVQIDVHAEAAHIITVCPGDSTACLSFLQH